MPSRPLVLELAHKNGFREAFDCTEDMILQLGESSAWKISATERDHITIAGFRDCAALYAQYLKVYENKMENWKTIQIHNKWEVKSYNKEPGS